MKLSMKLKFLCCAALVVACSNIAPAHDVSTNTVVTFSKSTVVVSGLPRSIAVPKMRASMDEISSMPRSAPCPTWLP